MVLSWLWAWASNTCGIFCARLHLALVVAKFFLKSCTWHSSSQMARILHLALLVANGNKQICVFLYGEVPLQGTMQQSRQNIVHYKNICFISNIHASYPTRHKYILRSEKVQTYFLIHPILTILKKICQQLLLKSCKQCLH